MNLIFIFLSVMIQLPNVVYNWLMFMQVQWRLKKKRKQIPISNLVYITWIGRNQSAITIQFHIMYLFDEKVLFIIYANILILLIFMAWLVKMEFRFSPIQNGIILTMYWIKVQHICFLPRQLIGHMWGSIPTYFAELCVSTKKKLFALCCCHFFISVIYIYSMCVFCFSPPSTYLQVSLNKFIVLP